MVTDTPKGYKRTEIGMLPDKWDVDRIKNRASITTGAKNTQDKIDDGEYPFFVRSQTVERINTYSYDGEAVLTAGDGVGTGKVFHYITGKFDFHQRVYKISDFSNTLDGRYFFFYFSNHFLNRIMQMTAKSSVDSVRREMIADMQIPLPSIPEQTAIATALSDTDKLIGVLEKLIAKKRNIKQGAMQELLTGKRRLPGFSGKWETKKLGDILKIKHGRSQKEVVREHGAFPIVATGGVIGWASEPIYYKPSVLIGRKGTIDAPQYFDAPFWAIDTIFYSEIFNYANAKFIFYRFNLVDWQNYNEASGVPSLNAKTIESIEIDIPSTNAEQASIANVLSDMDADIEKLEQELAKYRMIKQGMMQELLTGKTRLI